MTRHCITAKAPKRQRFVHEGHGVFSRRPWRIPGARNGWRPIRRPCRKPQRAQSTPRTAKLPTKTHEGPRSISPRKGRILSLRSSSGFVRLRGSGGLQLARTVRCRDAAVLCALCDLCGGSLRRWIGRAAWGARWEPMSCVAPLSPAPMTCRMSEDSFRVFRGNHFWRFGALAAKPLRCFASSRDLRVFALGMLPSRRARL
jgi:hypothetical protein